MNFLTFYFCLCVISDSVYLGIPRAIILKFSLCLHVNILCIITKVHSRMYTCIRDISHVRIYNFYDYHGDRFIRNRIDEVMREQVQNMSA